MGIKSGPRAPDPFQTAGAQSQVNQEAARQSAILNRYNIETPFGLVEWVPSDSGTKINQPQAPGSRLGFSGRQKTPGEMYSASGLLGGYNPNAKSFNAHRLSAREATLGGFTPSSSVSAPIDPTSGVPMTQRITLSPEMQRQFEQQQARNIALGDLAQEKIGQLPRGAMSFAGLPQLATGLDTSGLSQMVTGLDTSQLPSLTSDFSGDRERTEKAIYDRLRQLQRPGEEQRQKALESRLSVTGQPIGGEAYTTEQERYQRGVQEADLAAALESIRAGGAEQSRLQDLALRTRGAGISEQLAGAGLSADARRQGIAEQLQSAQLADRARSQGIYERQLERTQPMQELAALLGQTSALQMPQAPSTAQYQVAPADIAGLIGQNYQTQAQQQAAKKGGMTDLAGAGLTALMMPSDKRLKENIKYVGSENDHKFYSWDWNDKAKSLGLNGSSFGVIAQEVEEYAPELIQEVNGYKHVDYRGLLND